MFNKQDLTQADVSSLPEEVQEVVRYHSEADYGARELVSIKHTTHGDDEIKDEYYYIVYFQPLISGEVSPFDTFFFTTVSYHTWPKVETDTRYFSLDRYQMVEAMDYAPKKVHEDVEGVA